MTMKSIKQIPRPSLEGARKLTPLEMNGIKINRLHSVLTPDRLTSSQNKTADN